MHGSAPVVTRSSSRSLPGEGIWVLRDRLNAHLGGAPTRIDLALPHFLRPRLDARGDPKVQAYEDGSGLRAKFAGARPTALPCTLVITAGLAPLQPLDGLLRL